MRAAVRRNYCTPSQLEVTDVVKPKVKAEEVLIKVHATTVNRTDVGVLTGKPYAIRFFSGLFKPKRPVTGTDFAGVVESVGEGVSAYNAGDKVWGLLDDGLQSHAEYVVMKEDANLDLMPANISFSEATACLEAGHYARMHLNDTNPNKTERALVNGATGAIGSAILQMLKNHIGMEVTAVCNTKNIDLIKSLGADKIYNYEKEDFTQVDTSTYHYIYDAVGKSTFGKCKPLMKEGGIYTSTELGPNWENIYLPLFTKHKKKKLVFPLPKDIKGSLKFMKDLVEAGTFSPVIDRSYPLTEIRDAFEYVASGQKTGNVVLLVNKE